MTNLLKENWLKISIIPLSLLFLPIVVYADYGDAGFWTGLWQGITFPFRIFLKLIWTNLTIYEQFNSTYLYHVGFLVGVLVIIGGGSGARR